MRLRLMENGAEVALLETASAAALARQLARLREEVGEQGEGVPSLCVHVWHDHAWWNLSDDLSQFFAWVIETGTGSLDEARAFTVAPLSRPEWLFEAAQQMKTLLDVVAEVSPHRKQT